jgi:gas vesicle protein
MGTFAAGAQIATRGTQLFTLNGVGLFVWAYAVLFQPQAGEMTRVVLRENTDKATFVASLKAANWSYPQDTAPAPAKAVSAIVWQADGVVADNGRTWEIRLHDTDSEKLAAEKKKLEETRSPLLAEEKRLRHHQCQGRTEAN